MDVITTEMLSKIPKTLVIQTYYLLILDTLYEYNCTYCPLTREWLNNKWTWTYLFMKHVHTIHHIFLNETVVKYERKKSVKKYATSVLKYPHCKYTRVKKKKKIGTHKRKTKHNIIFELWNFQIFSNSCIFLNKNFLWSHDSALHV